MKIVVTLWPHGEATIVPFESVSPWDLLRLRMAWTAWQETDPLAKFIEDQEKDVQVSQFIFNWEDGLLTLEPEFTA